MDETPPADRDRLSLLVGGAALGFALSRVVQLPTQQFGLEILGSPLGVQLTTSWLMTVFVVGLVMTGVQSLLRSHPLAAGSARMAVHWILPAITALMAGAVLAQIEELVVWVAAMITALLLLGLITVNEYHSIDPSLAARAGRKILVTASAYSLALGFLIILYSARLRTLVAAPSALLVCGLLAVRLLWSSSRQSWRIGLYGAAVGVLMAQCVWVLGYWRIPPLSGGTLLLLVFYISTGVAQGVWEVRLGRRALVEYGLTALLAAVIVLVLGPR